MAAFAWLGPVREPVRNAALRFVRQLLATDEGRRILVEALPERRAHDRPRVSLEAWPAEHAYRDLGRAANGASRPAPIFITARFRTGSTLLWNLFRHVDGCTAYYEPLNERRWFDPSTRGDRIDRTHLAADEYWREYEGLEHLARFYDERFIDRDLYMSEHADDPALEAYIDALIAASDRRAVLQFNRVDFRLPWLRHRYSDARIVHLYRHPRDQWCSTLVDPSRVPREISVGDFARFDGFYLLRWATDLSLVFPFLCPDRFEHPYDLFYMIWRLSYAFGCAYADVSIRFEDLSAHPRTEIPRLLSACGIDQYNLDALTALVVRQASGKWRAWADDTWFAEREARVEERLQALCRAPFTPRVQEQSSSLRDMVRAS